MNWSDAPPDATHAWLDHSGDFIGWLKVTNWVALWQDGNHWMVIGRCVGELRGVLEPRP